MAIKIITDSGSDISINNDLGIIVVPLNIEFGNTEYRDGINLGHDEFYKKLVESTDFPKTSQPSPYDFEQEYKKIKEAGDTAIVICLSKKLSGTYNSAILAAENYSDCVYVVDSTNVSVGLHILVMYAFELLNKGLTQKEIIKELEENKEKIVVFGLFDTLEYLKRGGRIPAALALIANMISLKPVLGIDDGKITMLAKARGAKKGKKVLSELIQKSGGINFNMPLCVGFTGIDNSVLMEYMEENRELWENKIENLPIISIGATIGSHAGPKAIAVAFFGENNAE